jgi:Fe-S cluster assembly protein SufD
VPPLDESEVDRAAAGEPSWLAERRRAGFTQFQKLEMPTGSDDLWRHVDLDFDLRELATPGTPGAVPPGDGLLGDMAPVGSVVVVDGHVVDVVGGADAVLTSVTRAVDEAPAVAEDRLATGVAPDLDLFAAAHRAFSVDGAFLHVPAGAVPPGPFVVDLAAATAGTVSFPHVTVDAGASSQVSVVVRCRSPRDTTLVVVPQIEVFAGDNAVVRVTVVQDWGRATTAIAHQRMVAGRDATIVFAEAGLGGKLSRLHLLADLVGRGSTAQIIGAYFGEEHQVLDYRYFVRHAGPNTSSDMFLKGAVEDQALSVFTGLIRIEEEAQKTNAFQTNRNLILSDGAAAQSVPNLEILANDVRCGHGSTVGPLDDEQRYYLMSRGLPRDRADRLQVRGFFNQALARFPEPDLVAPLRDAITAKFAMAQEAGRV